MVRLVFRPYTQIRREICTLPSLRASTRVSPGFTLFRHRSPSFGSQQICSYSNLPQVIDRSIVPPLLQGFLPQRHESSFTFIPHQGFYTQILAYMLDSLVRVSRRVNENHFVRIAKNTKWSDPRQCAASPTAQLCCPSRLTTQVRDSNPNEGVPYRYLSPAHTYLPAAINGTRSPASSARPSPASRTDSDSPRITGPTHYKVRLTDNKAIFQLCAGKSFPSG